jgi:hypothetical protein
MQKKATSIAFFVFYLRKLSALTISLYRLMSLSFRKSRSLLLFPTNFMRARWVLKSFLLLFKCSVRWLMRCENSDTWLSADPVFSWLLPYVAKISDFFSGAKYIFYCYFIVYTRFETCKSIIFFLEFNKMY